MWWLKWGTTSVIIKQTSLQDEIGKFKGLKWMGIHLTRWRDGWMTGIHTCQGRGNIGVNVMKNSWRVCSVNTPLLCQSWLNVDEKSISTIARTEPNWFILSPITTRWVALPNNVRPFSPSALLSLPYTNLYWSVCCFAISHLIIIITIDASHPQSLRLAAKTNTNVPNNARCSFSFHGFALISVFTHSHPPPQTAPIALRLSWQNKNVW